MRYNVNICDDNYRNINMNINDDENIVPLDW